MMDWWVVSLDGSPSKRTNGFANLQRQGFDFAGRSMPRAYHWSGGNVIFTAPFGHTVNIWQIALPEHSGRVAGPARRLSSGTTLEVAPSLTSRGQLIFSSVNQSMYIGGAHLSADGVASQEAAILTDTGWESGPSISLDGRYLAFTGRSPDRMTVVRAKDLFTNQERTLAEHAVHPQISADGLMVAYSRQQPNGSKEVTSIDGSAAHRVANGGGYVYSWSHDNRLTPRDQVAV